MRFHEQAESNMNDLISEYQQYQEVKECWNFFKLLAIVYSPSETFPVQATIDDDDCFDQEEEDQDQD